jgi:hypothetical protein
VQECAALTLLMRPHASLAGPCGGHSGHPEDIYCAALPASEPGE